MSTLDSIIEWLLIWRYSIKGKFSKDLDDIVLGFINTRPIILILSYTDTNDRKILILTEKIVLEYIPNSCLFTIKKFNSPISFEENKKYSSYLIDTILYDDKHVFHNERPSIATLNKINKLIKEEKLKKDKIEFLKSFS